MSEEAIIDIFRNAGATEDEINEVRDILKKMKEGVLSKEETYYALMGLARENMIPLTPRQVGELRRLLGVEL